MTPYSRAPGGPVGDLLLALEPGFLHGAQGVPILASIPPETLNLLAPLLLRSRLVIIKPDALLTRKAGRVLDSILASGARVPLARRVLRPSAFEAEDLYRPNLTERNAQNQLGVWWINAACLTMGPWYVLLTWWPETDPRDLHAQISGWKGASDPHSSAEGSIRCALEGTNVAMNLVHTSDGPVSTLREALLFFTPEELLAVAQRCTSHAPSTWGAEHVPELNALAGSVHPRAHLDSALTACEIMQFAALSEGSRILLAVETLRNELESVPTSRARWRSFVAAAPGLVRACGPVLPQVARLILEVPEWTPARARSLDAALRRIPGIDSISALVITSSVANHRPAQSSR